MATVCISMSAHFSTSAEDDLTKTECCAAANDLNGLSRIAIVFNGEISVALELNNHHYQQSIHTQSVSASCN